MLHLAAPCITVLHFEAICCYLLRSGAICYALVLSAALRCYLLLSAAICCEMLRSALKCCIPSGLCRIVTVADFWPFLWFFRARVRSVLFFSPMGSHSVVAYHVMGQRSQLVDSATTGPIGGSVDRMGF